MTSQTILLACLALLTSEPHPSVPRLQASLCRTTVKPVKALLHSPLLSFKPIQVFGLLLLIVLFVISEVEVTGW